MLIAHDAMLGISLATMFIALPAHTSESWVCTEIIDNKPFVMSYSVSGDTLVHNNGKGRSTIIENNSDHIISYIAFSSNVKRYPTNSHPVVVSEPFVSYFIIEKSSGRFTGLSSATMTVFAENYGQLPEPGVTTGHCKAD